MSRIDMDNIDVDEIEKKIAIICYKFNNLNSWKEDLAQELRIHAYYVSDNYYDLYRKAIDFWRRVQSKETPEIPYFDLDILGGVSGQSIEHESMQEFDDLLALIRKELNRPSENKRDQAAMDLAEQLLDIIATDIDDRIPHSNAIVSDPVDPYINKRLNLSWVAANQHIGYKRVVNAMKFLEDIVRGLAAMDKIEIPKEFFNGYYDIR